MKRILLFLIAALGVLSNAVAADYRPFVEEGKTWWHETRHYEYALSPAFRTYEGITMRGDTVIDDIVWKKCYTIDLHKKLGAEPLVLMREADKKVYSIVLDYSVDIMLELNTEYLVYDFSLEADDSYYIHDDYVGDRYDRGLVRVSETGVEVQNGNEFRYQMAGLAYLNPTKCIEGIGSVKTNYFYMPFYPIAPALRTWETMLSYVTDKDNNIIYEVFEGRKSWEFAPPVAPKGYAYRPMGEEGKTWWYTSKKSDGDAEFGITVCGDTIVDGMTWKKLYFVNEKLEREQQPVAIIRDEDRRVYATCLAQSRDELPDYAPDYVELGKISNTCIYDFNLVEDETFTTVVGTGDAFVFRCRNAAYVENTYKWFRRNYLSYPGYASAFVYDGVGNTVGSCFFAPLIENKFEYEDNATLRWVTDAENEVVFTGAGGRKLWEGDYRSFVEEGKTWWHETILYRWALSPAYRTYEGITMRGDTVIDDVVWKKCYTIDLHKKLSAEPFLLMRESKKKVYSMALDDSAEWLHPLNAEYLIYDFTLEAGDSYELTDNPYYNGLVIVSETGEEVRDGDKFRYQLAGLSHEYPQKCVEGIGCVENTYFYMPFYPACACIPTSRTMLSYVTDKDNNIIYKVFDGRKTWEYAPPVAPKEYAYRPMGEEGKTWWYTSRKFDGDTEYGITVCGDTIVDGMTWKKLYFVNEKLEREQQPVAIIRDEDRRVYATCLAQSMDELPDYAPDYLQLGIISNTCIYDFNLIEDEAFTTVLATGNAFVFKCRNAAYVENTDAWFRRNYLTYPGYASLFAYDGVGNTEASCFFAPLIENKSQYEWNATLRWVTDAENEIVFTGAGGTKLWEQSGVAAVVAESGDEAVYYNLQGMPVADDRLVPGVYVKVLGGKVTKVVIR